MILMSSFVHNKINPTNWPKVYKTYFNEDDQLNVEAVFRTIMGAKDQGDVGKPLGADIFQNLVFTNKKTGDNEPCDEKKPPLAWLANIKGKNTAVMRVCDRG